MNCLLLNYIILIKIFNYLGSFKVDFTRKMLYNGIVIFGEDIFLMTDIKTRYINAKRRLFDKAYSGLNEKQREAVFTVNDPLLVLAGAGSGKTTVLVKRIAFIIKYGNAYFSEYVPYDADESYVGSLEAAFDLGADEIETILPTFASNPCPTWKILAITFTNKAANEIKSRLAATLGEEYDASEIWAGTFHSICVRILRTYHQRLGYGSSFSIYDTDDTKKAISAVMKECNIDEKTLPIKSVIANISRAKDHLITPEEFEAQAGQDYRLKLISRIYRAYQKRLKESNAFDFDDIIMQTVILLRDNEDVREHYQSRFKYVCVDEFQDTNKAQFVLTALLSGGYRNLMVVGDDDQSIYKFRGATIENILDFDRTYPEAKIVKLEQNYRSTQTILDAANAVIEKNESRKGKTLWTANDKGEKIFIKMLDDQNAEARFIVEYVMKAKSEGKNYRNFAILYRNNAQSNSIEKAFAKSAVPYRMLAGTRFSDRKEIRDVVAYLQVLINHNDKERLWRIINEPKRKIGEKTIAAVEMIAAEEGIGVFDVMLGATKYTALSRSALTLEAFAKMILELTELSYDVSLDVLFDKMLQKTGYRQMLIDAGQEEADRLENLDEFKSGIIEYMNTAEEPTLVGFLEENALVADVDKYDESADAVVMMTIHSAKGLEFPIVFLPGMEDGIFPGMQTITSGPAEMEEERRLAYVAITRAKEKLIILHTKNRLMYGQTSYNPISRFVNEIPDELIERPKTMPHQQSQFRTYIRQESEKPRYNDSFTVSKPLFAGGEKLGNKELFAPGDRVSHMTFGVGEILSARKMGGDTLYEIAFEKVGTKKLMATYAKLKKL